MSVDTAASFVDECTVHVRGGEGGHGVVSFRREAHVPRGGPDGGDGGRGGDVILVASANTTSLLDLRRRPHRRGADGANGQGMNRTGADATDKVIAVPVGTVVRHHDSGAVLADLVEDGQRFVAARGGRGGRGNTSFTNRHRRLPKFAERGEKVDDISLRLELKVVADVGLVGFPSVGKSSLVRQLSAATPRVEAWPFTTLTPHLGVMRAGNRADGQPIDVVLADVPGLIEGASEGKGLGLQFLRHIERCLVLLHVLDAAPLETDRDPVEDLAILRRELGSHDPSLLERPQLVVLNKIDLPDGQAMAELVRAQLEEAGEEVIEVSAVAGVGLDTLRYRLGVLVDEERERVGPVRVHQSDDEEVLLHLTPAGDDISVERDDDGSFRVVGRRVERWVQMLPLEDWGAVRYLQGRMRRAGIERQLIAAGAREGDEVVIAGAVFEFAPELDDLPYEERAAVLAGEADDFDLADLDASDKTETEIRGSEHLAVSDEFAVMAERDTGRSAREADTGADGPRSDGEQGVKAGVGESGGGQGADAGVGESGGGQGADAGVGESRGGQDVNVNGPGFDGVEADVPGIDRKEEA